MNNDFTTASPVWRFIQQHNRHFRMTDLVVAILLCTFLATTLPVLIAARLLHGEVWNWDLFLMTALCITGLFALFVYARLTLERVWASLQVEERCYRRMTKRLIRKTVALTKRLV